MILLSSFPLSLYPIASLAFSLVSSLTEEERKPNRKQEKREVT